jgi:hypothetical protein
MEKATGMPVVSVLPRHGLLMVRNGAFDARTMKKQGFNRHAD